MSGDAPSACPRCGAALQDGQSWCTECGLAARTAVAPTPAWRNPLLVIGGVTAVALVALVLAFVLITRGDNPIPATTAVAAPAAVTPAPVTTPPAPATAP